MTRFSRILGSLVAVALSVIPLTGCSQTEAYKRAALPLGSNIHSDVVVNYIPALTDTAEKAQRQVQADQFIAFLNEGDSLAVASIWFGTDNLRDFYEHALAADAKFSQLGGDDLFVIKTNNIKAFDYITSTGKSQLTPRQ